MTSSQPAVPVKYKRKCENWIQTFLDWSLPRSEAPESFHFWAAMFALASVTKRNICVPKELLGGWEAHPGIMYIIFVAPPGKARKSTTARYAEDLISEVPNITKAPTAVTTEMMLKMLSESDDASISIFSSEFASFVYKSESIYDILTDLFDGKKDYSSGTISRDIELTERPCVTLLAATTPGWIADNMPESVIGGGFASRVIFVFEDKVRRRQLFYESLEYSYLDKLREDLIKDLIHIHSLEGKFTLSDDAKSYLEQWYDGLDKQNIDNYNERMSGYHERKPAHMFKIAMMLHIARKDSLIIEKEDAVEAINVLSKIERKLPRTFQNIGKNVYANEMHTMLEFIRMRKKVAQQEMRNKFLHIGQPEIIDKLCLGMCALGKIHKQDEGDDVYYIALGD